MLPYPAAAALPPGCHNELLRAVESDRSVTRSILLKYTFVMHLCQTSIVTLLLHVFSPPCRHHREELCAEGEVSLRRGSRILLLHVVE